MPEQQQGTCQCRQISYVLASEPVFTYACYCYSCQKRTGSAFSMGMIVVKDTVTISGELNAWQRTSDAGETNTRYSCSDCGNIIFGEADSSPGIIKLQAGTLEDTSHVVPDVHLWTSRAQPWLTIPKDAVQYEQQPDDLNDLLGKVQNTQKR